MSTRTVTRWIREGKFVAEIEIHVTDVPESWSPVMSVDDALLIDEVRDALRNSDIARASLHAKVYSLTPIAV